MDSLAKTICTTTLIGQAIQVDQVFLDLRPTAQFCFEIVFQSELNSLSFDFNCCVTDLLSPGAESDAVMVEGCLDDPSGDRRGSLLDDMDEALTSDGGLMLDTGSADLSDLRDPDLDDSNRAIR